MLIGGKGCVSNVIGRARKLEQHVRHTYGEVWKRSEAKTDKPSGSALGMLTFVRVALVLTSIVLVGVDLTSKLSGNSGYM